MSGSGKILLVEDSDKILELMAMMLSNGRQILKARNGAEAVYEYRTHKPDLVFMDIVMPVLDGIEATREIVKFNPEAKIIGVTAYYTSKSKEMLDAGAREVIRKPFTVKQLIEIVKKYMPNDTDSGCKGS